MEDRYGAEGYIDGLEALPWMEEHQQKQNSKVTETLNNGISNQTTQVTRHPQQILKS